MNRSILIVICDFLLVSLLAFSTVDINKVSDRSAPHQMRMDIATNQVESGRDLAAVMRLALDEERKSHDRLLGELSRTRESALQQQALLSEREKQVQTFQQQLESREQQAARLQQEQAALQQQFAAAQTNIQSLAQQLKSHSTEGVITKERLAAAEADLLSQKEQALALQQQLAQLAKTNDVVQSEKQRLANQLQVAEAEKRFAAQQVARMQDEVKTEREEKARLAQQATKLAEGVNALASKSGELAQEIRDNRPLAPNTIFNELITNRVQAHFDAVRPGFFGNEATKSKDTETVLATDGTNVFALTHVQDTPLTFWIPGTDWEALTGTLARGTQVVNIASMSFYDSDPRVVLIRLSEVEARKLGCRIYRISSDPYKFQDAVLVGAREGYYGECRFEIDLTTPGYVKLDRSFLKGIFGKFNPSRGDLVLSKTGELLGVMANSTYCVMIQNFGAAATFRFGRDMRDQHTGMALARFYSVIYEMPFKLQ